MVGSCTALYVLMSQKICYDSMASFQIPKADKIRLSGAVHCFLMFVLETFSVTTLLWVNIKKVKRDED